MDQGKKHKAGVDLIFLILLLSVAYLALVYYYGSLTPLAPVASDSMAPSIERGDLIILRTVPPQDLQVGDIVQIKAPSAIRAELGIPEYILHRIENIEMSGSEVLFTTKGDANLVPDPIPVTISSIKGKVANHVPQIGYIFLYLYSPYGRIFLIVTIASIAIYILYLKGAKLWTDAASKLTEGQGGEGEPDRSGYSGHLERIDKGVQGTQEALTEFSQAIAEYARHLRSHTMAVQEMGTAGKEISASVRDQRAMWDSLLQLLSGLSTNTPMVSGLPGSTVPTLAKVARPRNVLTSLGKEGLGYAIGRAIKVRTVSSEVSAKQVGVAASPQEAAVESVVKLPVRTSLAITPTRHKPEVAVATSAHFVSKITNIALPKQVHLVGLAIRAKKARRE